MIRHVELHQTAPSSASASEFEVSSYNTRQPMKPLTLVCSTFETNEHECAHPLSLATKYE
jgi:hypothetical protein